MSSARAGTIAAARMRAGLAAGVVAGLVAGLGAGASLGGTAGCAASRSEVRAARAAAYDTDFAVVFNRTLAAVRALYPTAQEDAAAGIVRTSWHEVRLGNTDGSGAYQRDFVRFDVRVMPPRPWRVRVRGEAARWDFANAMPAPLEGGDEPPWLQGRIEGLQVAIHQRLAAHAVLVEEPAPAAPAARAPEDLARFGDIPPAAARAVARVVAALDARDLDALGAAMHEDFVWSLGAPPSKRSALVMWQADGTLLATLRSLLEAGCRPRADAGRAGDAGHAGSGSGIEVTCPPAAAEPGFAGPHAIFAPGPDGVWTMRAFLGGD